jgi:serine/threonine protein kinase
MMQPGSELGTCTILGSLATTGTAAADGELWRARDSRRGHEVVIRTLPALTEEGEHRARIEAAARRLATLEHPGIARVYGLEESDGTPFLVTELVEGETLAEKLRRGAIPGAEGLGLALQVAQALEAAHQSGILHRDLNPSNIKVQGSSGPASTRGRTAASTGDSRPRVTGGTVKIVDLGLAGLLDPLDTRSCPGTAPDPRGSRTGRTRSPRVRPVCSSRGTSRLRSFATGISLPTVSVL